MFILDFKKNGEHLYTIAPKKNSVVHIHLVDTFKEYSHLLFLQRQRLSFFNPMFVEKVRDICTYSNGFYNNRNYHIIPDRVDVRYLRKGFKFGNPIGFQKIKC